MKKYILLFSTAILVQLFFISCSKNDTTPPADQETVYVAGINNNSSGARESVIWKNGAKQILPATNGYSYSVVVSGSDVYAVGEAKHVPTNKIKAMIWKNGVATDLTNGSDAFASATAIYANGADIYAAGLVQDLSFNMNAVYWKNGTVTPLLPGLIAASIQTIDGIYANNTDVYVVGSIQKSGGEYAIAQWKNGVISEVSSGSSDFWCTGLFVSGSDVYITGYEDDHATYVKPRLWKNGTIIPLNNAGASSAQAHCVFVNGSDVYVGGFIVNPTTNQWNPRYWKNGTLVTLPDGPKSSWINGMYVNGTDVYAVGWQENATNVKVATQWKNGTASPLSDANGSGEAYAVLVK
jgi:hypothetical protein